MRHTANTCLRCSLGTPCPSGSYQFSTRQTTQRLGRVQSCLSKGRARKLAAPVASYHSPAEPERSDESSWDETESIASTTGSSHPECLEGEELFHLPAGWGNMYKSNSNKPLHVSDDWDLTDDEMFIPAPCNLPTNEDSMPFTTACTDLFTLTDQPGIDLLMVGQAALSRLGQVYVIFFYAGEPETEGIYSLRAFGDDGLPQECIIVFESEDDATRYAGLLEATMEFKPNVCSIPPSELLKFCVEQGYHCRLEPKGSLLIPPDYNVGVTDWERSIALRDGRWAVLDHEPELAAGSAGRGPQPHMQGSTQVANLPKLPGTAARYTGFSDAELDNIKAKLEKLLPDN